LSTHEHIHKAELRATFVNQPRLAKESVTHSSFFACANNNWV